MNSFEDSPLNDLAKQSISSELARQTELNELRMENYELKVALYLKEKELNEIYDRMYIAAGFLKKKSDKKKIVFVLNSMRNRTKNNSMNENRFQQMPLLEYLLDGYKESGLNKRKRNRDDRYDY